MDWEHDDAHMDLNAMYGAYCVRSGVNPLKVALQEVSLENGEKAYRFGVVERQSGIPVFREPTKRELWVECAYRFLETHWVHWFYAVLALVIIYGFIR